MPVTPISCVNLGKSLTFSATVPLSTKMGIFLMLGGGGGSLSEMVSSPHDYLVVNFTDRQAPFNPTEIFN